VTPEIEQFCQSKMYLFKSKTTPPKLKHLLRENNVLLIAYTQYTKHVRFYLYHSVSLFPSSQSVPSSYSHSLLTFPSSSLSFHNISASFSSIAVDIQHFLKPLTVEQRSCTDGVNNSSICILDFCVMSFVWSVWVRGPFYGF
jgi:hypothetical protein